MREYAQNLNNKTVSARPKCVLEETGKKQAFVHVVRRHCGGQTFISGRALKISKLCFLSGACERSSRDQTYRPQFCGSRTRSRVSGGGRGRDEHDYADHGSNYQIRASRSTKIGHPWGVQFILWPDFTLFLRWMDDDFIV